MSKRRTVFVLVPVEVELYDYTDEGEKIGSIKMPDDKDITQALESGCAFSDSEVAKSVIVHGVYSQFSPAERVFVLKK